MIETQEEFFDAAPPAPPASSHEPGRVSRGLTSFCDGCHELKSGLTKRRTKALKLGWLCPECVGTHSA